MSANESILTPMSSLPCRVRRMLSLRRCHVALFSSSGYTSSVSHDTRNATRWPKRFSISSSVPSVLSTMSCSMPAVMISWSSVTVERICATSSECSINGISLNLRTLP